VIQLVLKEAALLLAAGLVVGVGLALSAGRAAAAMLHGLKRYDSATLGGAGGGWVGREPGSGAPRLAP